MQPPLEARRKGELHWVHYEIEEHSWQLVMYREQREHVPYWLRKVVGVQLRQTEADIHDLQYFIVTLHSRQVKTNLDEGYSEKPSRQTLQFISESDIR